MEQDLWQELKDAVAFPQDANLKRLCQLLDWAIAQLPENQQLYAAGTAIEQIAAVYALKADWLITTWQENHETQKLSLPVLTAEELDGWIRQSMVLDLDVLVEQPVSERSRREQKPQPTDSVAVVVDQSILLEMIDQMEAEADHSQMIRQLAGEEDPVKWSGVILDWLQENGSEQQVHLLHLYSEIGLPFVELWLGLLLGGFELEQPGDFYSSDIWIRYKPEMKARFL